MKTLPVLSSFLVLVAVASPVHAAGDPAIANPRFAELDADHDGRLTQTEFLVSIRGKQQWWRRGESAARTEQNSATPEIFTALDRNRDHYVDAQEWEQGQQLLQSRGDDGEGASRTRNRTPPGDPERSQKSRAETDRK